MLHAVLRGVCYRSTAQIDEEENWCTRLSIRPSAKSGLLHNSIARARRFHLPPSSGIGNERRHRRRRR